MSQQKLRPLIILFLTVPMFTACSGHFTLSTQTTLKTSKSVFLKPSSQKTVLVETTNTSDNPNVQFSRLSSILEAKGYQVVTDAEEAQFLLQVNVVYCDEQKPGTTADTLVAGGFGGTLGATAGTAAALSGSSFSTIPILGAAGAVGGVGISKITEDTVYVCATDVQVTEKTKEVVEQTITTQTNHGGKSLGLSLLGGLFTGRSREGPSVGQVEQGITETRRGKERLHQVRYVASAQKMWLDLEEATPVLTQRLENGIAGLFSEGSR
ncbi:MAG: conjugal transfer protein TraT [Nitrospirales bacterium]|nr:MAG: conjugal transfer protein TraT [Nitrospirales bacterium]